MRFRISVYLQMFPKAHLQLVERCKIVEVSKANVLAYITSNEH